MPKRRIESQVSAALFCGNGELPLYVCGYGSSRPLLASACLGSLSGAYS